MREAAERNTTQTLHPYTALPRALLQVLRDFESLECKSQVSTNLSHPQPMRPIGRFIQSCEQMGSDSEEQPEQVLNGASQIIHQQTCIIRMNLPSQHLTPRPLQPPDQILIHTKCTHVLASCQKFHQLIGGNPLHPLNQRKDTFKGDLLVAMQGADRCQHIGFLPVIDRISHFSRSKLACHRVISVSKIVAGRFRRIRRSVRKATVQRCVAGGFRP